MKHWQKITLVVILLSLQCEIHAGDNEDCEEKEDNDNIGDDSNEKFPTTKTKATHTAAATQTPNDNLFQPSTNESISSKLSQTFSICKKKTFYNAILYLQCKKQKV